MEHPITPPPELISQWLKEFYGPETMPGMAPGEAVLHVAAVAARWGADQELQACCEWVDSPVDFEDYRPGEESKHLRAARRPKPPSLKQRALEALEQVDGWGVQSVSHLTIHDELVAGVDVIRRALESLPDPQD